MIPCPVKLSDVHYMRLIIVLWMALLSMSYVSNVIGRAFPAAAPMQLTKYQGIGSDLTLIWGESARLRPECSFRRIDWYLGTRTGKNVPADIWTGKPILRDDGSFSFGPWFLSIPVNDVVSNSFADTFHQCTFMGIQEPWLIRSRFWN